MANVIYKKGQSVNLNTVEITDGQILVTEDMGEMYVDMSDGTRKKISDTSKPGLKTPEGGEIFNDYEDNQSISEFSSAKGRHTFAGTKFFYIIDKNEINKTYTLKDYYLDISSSGELAVNDLFSITTGGNREDCGTIKSITQEEGTNNAIVTVSNWYWDNSEGLTEPTYDNPSKSFIFRVIDKPMCGTDIMGTGASSEGCSTKALMMGCHSEGYFTIAGGKYSHAEGRDTRAGYASHAEGWGTKAMGLNAHSEGHFTDAQGWYSHSEGNNTKSIGQSSHAEGANTEASGSQAHAEGSNTLASNFNTHAEGKNTQATKNEAHAEGLNTTASGSASHAEGEGTTASSYSSHSEGGNTTASGYSSHAEGENTTASGGASHSEGVNTVAGGYSSHAEGRNTKASGPKAHAEGEDTTASGYCSHAGGFGTIASGSSQTSIGKYNREDDNALLIVGNGSGSSATERNNAFTVNRNGTATVQTNPIEDMDVATKEYVDNEIATFDFIKVVNKLPATGLPNKIYLVPNGNTENQDLFDEYVWANDKFEFLGTKQFEIDLTDYYTKGEVDNITTTLEDKIEAADKILVFNSIEEFEKQRKLVYSNTIEIASGGQNHFIQSGIPSGDYDLYVSVSGGTFNHIEINGTIYQDTFVRISLNDEDNYIVVYVDDLSYKDDFVYSDVTVTLNTIIEQGTIILTRNPNSPDYWWAGGSAKVIETDLSNYYTKEEIDTAIGDIEAAFDELHTYAQALVNGGNA